MVGARDQIPHSGRCHVLTFCCSEDNIDISEKSGVRPQIGVNLIKLSFLLFEDF